MTVNPKRRILWLLNHPIWNFPKGMSQEDRAGLIHQHTWEHCISMEYVFVNPETETIEDNGTLNTAFRVWIEAGPWHYVKEMDSFTHSHDIRLDCGGASVQEAFLTLADLVETYYNDDGTEKPYDWDGWWNSVGADEKKFLVA